MYCCSHSPSRNARLEEGIKLFREKFPALQVLMLTIIAEQEKVFESIQRRLRLSARSTTPPAKLLDFIRGHEARANVA